MNARENIAYHLWMSVPSRDNDEAKATAQQWLDDYRDEVLAKADLLPKADVVAWLAKKAREDTPVWQLASKVDRGAVRPDNLRMLPATFFEPDRSYLVRGFEYRCRTVEVHPGRGEREAWGWLHRGGDVWRLERLYDADWTDAAPHTGEAAPRG